MGNAEIVSAIHAVFPDASVIECGALAGGMSAQMHKVLIEQPHGRRRTLIVRKPAGSNTDEQRSAACYETRTLRLVHGAGLKSPEVFERPNFELAQPAPLLIMEFLDGVPDYDPSDRSQHALALADQLAAIHSVDIDEDKRCFLRQRNFAMTEAQTDPADDIDASLGAKRIRRALHKASPSLQYNESRLLHGDFWPGNLLWNGPQFVGVVDWEDACFGDPLFDLGIARLDLAWILGLPAMNAFTQRYQTLLAIDYRQLPLWDLTAALRLIRISEGDFADWAAAWREPPFSRADISEQSMRDNYQRFLNQAFEHLNGCPAI